MPQQPKDTPIIQKPTPIVLDELLIEETDSNKALYDRMLEYGHYHPNRQKYPTYRFLKQEPTDYGGMRYYWANDFSGQDAYNASKTYLMESNAHPIFTRSYRVLRSEYLATGPSAALSAFTGLVTVRVTNAGSGYTKDFAVTFSSGAGSNAAGIALVDTASGTVIYIALTNVGAGYTSAPSVVLSAGDGTGATATAYIQPTNALLVSEKHSKLDDGDPYTSLYDKLTMQWMTLPGPILTGSQPDKTSGILANFQKQLVASGTVTGGTTGAGLLALTILNAGSGFTAGTYNLGFSGGGGTGATGTYTVTGPSPAGKIGSVTLTSGGAGFLSAPTASISGGGGSGATVSVTLVGKPIASLTLLSSDTTFTDAATLTITDSGTGIGALGTATLAPTTVDSVMIDNGGSGYSAATVAFTGGGGTGAAGTVNLTGDVVTSITMTNNGSGYTSRPAVTISGDGTGAVAHAVLGMTSVASVALTATGNLYQAPSVMVTDGSNTAQVQATIQPTSIASLTLTAAGSGYSSPTLTITGGFGSGATGTATLATGTITSVSLTNPGSGYTGNPTITTPSGGGSGASIIATVGSKTFIDVEPQDSRIDLVMRTTIDHSTFPAKKTFPISFRIQRTDFSLASLIIAQAGGNIAVGLNENSLQGGNGPVKAFVDELYMSDSEYAAYDPGIFSTTGESQSYTLTYAWADSNNNPHVFTGRVTPISQGTTAGVLDLSYEQQQYEVRKVRRIYITQNY